jgi:predicted nucleotidyltransferase
MIRLNIKEKLKGYFLMNPTKKMRVREIEREVNIPLPSAIRYCKELNQEGILKIIKMGNIQFYTADRSNENYKLEKKLFNLKQIYKSKIIASIKESLNNPSIILFGSYAKGEDIEDSDIDIYLETPSIQIFKFSNLNQISNKHLANNIINGITLNNPIAVFK